MQNISLIRRVKIKGEREKMITTLLFDLDGTLTLSGDQDFMKGYLGLLVPRFSHLMSADKFVAQMLSSTEVMKHNRDGSRRNIDVFMDDFCTNSGLSRFLVEPVFDDFYQYEFPELKERCKPHPLAREVVKTALDQGLKVAIASNPVLPEIAMRERLKWAEIGDLPLMYLPSIEKMHYCKPQVEFFHELLEKIEAKPSECLMVGDDGEEDMVASEIGMHTYFIDRKSDETTYKPSYVGNLDHLLQLIEKISR